MGVMHVLLIASLLYGFVAQEVDFQPFNFENLRITLLALSGMIGSITAYLAAPKQLFSRFDRPCPLFFLVLRLSTFKQDLGTRRRTIF